MFTQHEKGIKIISIIVILIMSFQILCPTVYASIYDSVRNESGPAPEPPTPGDDSRQDNPPSTGDSEEIRYCYSEINGTVYEDLGHIKFVGPNENGTISENNTELKPIKDILVKLYDSNNRLKKTTRTDSNGKYSFTGLSDGTYHTEFWYGGTTGADFNSNDDIKNILIYNGHDYITVKVPNSEEYIDSEKVEVINSGKGAMQLYLAIDCSYSMRNEKINGVSKLNYIVNAAESLCDSLLDLDDNIYIGLVFFSGTCYRAASLTKDITVLKDELEDIKTNNWYTANTNIVKALNKVNKSFYNSDRETSNRYLVLLSDGIPTSAGSTHVYNDDDDATVMNKLNIISQATKNKLKTLHDDGVYTISLFTKTDDEDENTLVKNTFEEYSKIFRNIENIDDTVDMIKNQLSEFITETARAERKKYTTSNTTVKGLEDETRRNEVDRLFESDDNKLNYKNTIMFDQIENYTGTSDSKKTAKALSKATKMKVYGGEYKIESVPNPSRVEIKDDDGNIIRIIQYQEASYDNKDVWLARRPTFSLTTSATATQSRIIVQNGAVQKEEVRDVGAGPNEFILHYIENDLLYGAEVELEYTINVKNTSSVQCNYLELLVQLPTGFSYKKGDDRVKALSNDEVQELINNGLVVEEKIDRQKEMLKITLDNNGQGENGFYIPSGGGYNVKVTINKISSGLDDNDIVDIKLNTEVLQYKNETNRRMAIVGNSGRSAKLAGVYPGDGTGVDHTDEITNSYITIIPPTGIGTNKYNINTVIPKIILVILGGIAISIIILVYRKK